MATTKAAAAPAGEAAAKEKERPKAILRGVSNGKTTIVLMQGANSDLQGFIVGEDGARNRNVFGFYNEKDGKKFITLKEYVVGKDPQGNSDRYKLLGFGNAMNARKDGKPVYFDTVIFNIDGKPLSAQLTKHGEQFATKMGFAEARIERPKKEAAADTDTDAAAAARPRQRG